MAAQLSIAAHLKQHIRACTRRSGIAVAIVAPAISRPNSNISNRRSTIVNFLKTFAYEKRTFMLSRVVNSIGPRGTQRETRGEVLAWEDEVKQVDAALSDETNWAASSADSALR